MCPAKCERVRLKKFEIVAKEGAFECGRRESVVIDEKLLVCVLYE
jgi:hypothetical protein